MLAAAKRLFLANLSFTGRLSRKGLWASIGLAYGVGLLFLPFSILLQTQMDMGGAAVSWAASAVSVLLGVPIALFFAGAAFRRLHDRGRRAWWLLVFFGPHALAVSLASVLMAPGSRVLPAGVIFGMVFAAPFLAWGMVEILMLRGTIGPNRFGQDPAEATSGSGSS